MNPFRWLSHRSASGYYWLTLALLGLLMLTTALFFQYQKGYGPCLLCIQVRVLVLGMGVAGLVGLWGRYYPRVASALHAIVTGLLLLLTERSWQLLATERHWVIGSCSLKLGLPDWFALDSWFPTLFGVEEPCGTTPPLFFGITMAEALFVFGILMSVVSLLLLIGSFVRWVDPRGER